VARIDPSFSVSPKQEGHMQSKFLTWMVCSISFVAAESALADGPFSNVADVIKKEWNSLQVLPSSAVDGTSSGFGLTSFDRHQVIRKFLGGRGLHPGISLAPMSASQESKAGFGLIGEHGMQVRDYSLSASGYDICKSSVRSIELSNGRMRVLGALPDVDSVQVYDESSWVLESDARREARNELLARVGDADSIVEVSAIKCLFAVERELTPAWKVTLRSGVTPYVLYVGNQGLIEGDVLAFDANATVYAYDTNSKSGTLTNFTIAVNGDGYMTNEFFTTADGAGGARKQSGSNQFTDGPGTTYFAEQSVFAHTNVHYDFTTQNGYTWKGNKPLTIKPHVTFSNGLINNAQYTPFDGKSGPFILVGDGDGSVLQNLAFDADVVSHEFGHHVVFGSLTTTSGESLVIHEGLSDSLTFLRTGDACLGESICPSTSTLCQVSAQCLRSGTLTMKYKDTTYNNFSGAAHKQSQVVSGLFWDLRKGGKIPAADLNKLAITAISFLPTTADMKALVTAMLDADYSLYSKKYQTVITEAASARGLGTDTLGIDLSSIDGLLPDQSGGGGGSSSSSKKGFLGLCSIGSGQGMSDSSVFIVILLLIPVLVAGLKRPKKAPVPVRKK
jgi:hypothetical protein